jgi:hypothetical protein
MNLFRHDKNYVGKTVQSADIVIKTFPFSQDYVTAELHITCDDGTVVRVVDEEQICCEYRYITCDDDLDCLIGGTLIDIMEKEVDIGEDEYHEIAFVEIQTTKGCVTIATHNEHNGYYGGFNLRVYVNEVGG